MTEHSRNKSGVWGFVLGVTAMGALYGWFAYADEIAQDVNAVAAQVSAVTGNNYPVDPAAVNLMIESQKVAEVQQNNGIIADMYSQGPLASDPNAPRSTNILTSHFDKFCSKNGPESGNCTDDPLLEFGDGKVSSILSKAKLNDVSKDAINQFLYNLIPIPANNLAPFVTNGKVDITKFPTSLDSADPNAKNYKNPQKSFADAYAETALLSIARHPYAEMIGKRTSPSDGGESIMQMMERVAMQRYMSSAWATAVKTMQTNDLLKEMVLMQAYQNWLETERYKQTERLEALLSAMIIQNVKSSQAIQASFSSQPAPDVTTMPAPPATGTTSP